MTEIRKKRVFDPCSKIFDKAIYLVNYFFVTVIQFIMVFFLLLLNIDIPNSADSDAVKSEKNNESIEETEKKETEERNKEEVEEESQEVQYKEVEAATKIQAVFRGHHARKSMKDTEASSKGTNTEEDREPTREELQEEFRADDVGKLNSLLIEYLIYLVNRHYFF